MINAKSLALYRASGLKFKKALKSKEGQGLALYRASGLKLKYQVIL